MTVTHAGADFEPLDSAVHSSIAPPPGLLGVTGVLIGLEQVFAGLFSGDLDFDGPPPEVVPDPGAATELDFSGLLTGLFGGWLW